MPTTNEEYKVINERYNEIYSARSDQLDINTKGWKGGRPYVEARLTRFPGESNEDWEGGNRKGGTPYAGRKEQAHVIPHLGRIVQKINQHVFAVEPKREGLAPEIAEDISSNGSSINELMALVNSYYTVCGWCWIRIDAPMIAPDEQISQLAKEQNKIRPYMTVYSPLSVIDWYFNSVGELQWVLTEGYDYIASDPKVLPVSRKYRKLWEKGLMTKYITKRTMANRLYLQKSSYCHSKPMCLSSWSARYPQIPGVLTIWNQSIEQSWT